MFPLLVHILESMLLISPLWYLYTKASERHLTLEDTIGPNHLEIKALNTIWNLAAGSTFTVLFLTLLQIALFVGYNHYGHPWKIFLLKDPPRLNEEDIEINSMMNNGVNKTLIDAPNDIEIGSQKQDGTTHISPTCDSKKESEIERHNDKPEKEESSDKDNSLDEAYAILEKSLNELKS